MLTILINIKHVGIANALDLTDRVLPRLHSHICQPQLLHFAPYTIKQIVTIMQKYHDTIIITIITWKVFMNIQKRVYTYILSCKTHFQEGVCFICCKYVVCHGKCFFCLTLVANDQLPVPKTHRITACLVDSLLSGLLWTHFTLDGYLGGDKTSLLFPKYGYLGGDKTSSLFPKYEVNDRTSNNLFLLSNSSVFHWQES